MKTWMRALLLWLTVMAIPVQGLAASLMLFCGHSHQRFGAFVAPEAQGSMTQHAHSAPEAAAREHAMALCHDATVGEAADRAATLHGDFSCSACAACCAVLALPARMVLPAQPDKVRAFAAPPMAPVRSHHPDGLDRPPRALFA